MRAKRGNPIVSPLRLLRLYAPRNDRGRRLLAITERGCRCEHLQGAWQSPVLVIGILDFDIVQDLEFPLQGLLRRYAPRNDRVVSLVFWALMLTTDR